jgi:hypothetical protein
MDRVAPSRKGIASPGRVSKPRHGGCFVAAVAFARAITSRYSRGRFLFWRRLNAVLLRHRSGITVKFIQAWNATWHLAPRLTFALLIHGERKSGAGAPLRRELAARLRPHLAASALRARTSSDSPHFRERDRFIRYLTTCRSRKDLHSDNSEPSVRSSLQRHRPSSRFEELPEPAPLALRRLQRPAALQELQDTLPSLGKPHSLDAAQPENWRSAPRASSTKLDINQLTQQVIQAIDRRIIAQRERLGRA